MQMLGHELESAEMICSTYTTTSFCVSGDVSITDACQAEYHASTYNQVGHELDSASNLRSTYTATLTSISGDIGITSACQAEWF